MMVRMQEGVVTGCAAIELELPHQPRLDQRMQGIVNSRARRPRIALIQSRSELFRSGVNRMPQQVVEYRDTLRRASQSRAG